jgi:dolichyl-phosphate beta-glucosyltransferase
MPQTLLVVPCFNEARRLDCAAFVELATSARTGLLFVDDGSIDATPEVLESIRSHAPDAVDILRLARNVGKAEAVRRGLLAAVERGALIVGYADADLSTPTSELLMLLDVAEGGKAAVLGSRVALLGTSVERRTSRRYLGRLFAAAASFALSVPVYDTQCGAKWFRTSDAFGVAIATPFRSAWAFDVELLGRLLIGGPGAAPLRADMCAEVPLRRWRDVDGGKLTLGGMTRSGIDLVRIWNDLRRRRRDNNARHDRPA